MATGEFIVQRLMTKIFICLDVALSLRKELAQEGEESYTKKLAKHKRLRRTIHKKAIKSEKWHGEKRG